MNLTNMTSLLIVVVMIIHSKSYFVNAQYIYRNEYQNLDIDRDSEICNIIDMSLYMCKYDNECRDNFSINKFEEIKQIVTKNETEIIHSILNLMAVNINNDTENRPLFNNADVPQRAKDIFIIHYTFLSNDMENINMDKDIFFCDNILAMKLWLKSMKKFTLCNPNESYELGLGCICNNGKICNRNTIMYYRENSFILIVLFLLCVIVLFSTLIAVKSIVNMEVIISAWLNAKN